MNGIIRVNKSDNYSVIPNQVTRNSNLTFGARGLLCYLLTKPDEWQVRVTDLVSQNPEGLCAIRSLLSELEAHGHLKRRRISIANGHFDWETTVYEETQKQEKQVQMSEPPSNGFPPMVKPPMGNRPIYEVLNKEVQKDTNVSILSCSKSDIDAFDNSLDAQSTPGASAPQAVPSSPALPKCDHRAKYAVTAEEIYRAFPKKEAPGKACDEINKAMAKLAKSGGPWTVGGLDYPVTDPSQYLLYRTNLYAQFRNALKDKNMHPAPARWFRDAYYATDDEIWKHQGERDAREAAGDNARESESTRTGRILRERERAALEQFALTGFEPEAIDRGKDSAREFQILCEADAAARRVQRDVRSLGCGV